MSDQPNSNQVPSTAEDQQTNRRSIAPYVVGAIFVCLVVGGVFYAVSSRTKRPDEAEPPETTVAQQADVPASPEERWRLNDYVGSSKCAECHAAIAETFAAHPMANTLATVADASPIEMVEDDASEFEAFGRQYRVERDGDRMIHTEFMTDEDGEAIYEQSEEVHFAVGSGMNARTYMMNHDGVMFESPITWYTEKAIWDLSPGYHENPAQRFTRRITDGCLQCHSGLPLPTGDGTSARFAKEPFFELGIGCERCHGPGRQHVEKFESGGGQLTGVNQDDMLIVNRCVQFYTDPPAFAETVKPKIAPGGCAVLTGLAFLRDPSHRIAGLTALRRQYQDHGFDFFKPMKGYLDFDDKARLQRQGWRLTAHRQLLTANARSLLSPTAPRYYYAVWQAGQGRP